jgi:osmotically inducible lipoprotein OsmB
MFKTAFIVALLSTTLAGCMANDTQRALVGAAAGAVVADATGNDALTGAALGAGAGLIIK